MGILIGVVSVSAGSAGLPSVLVWQLEVRSLVVSAGTSPGSREQRVHTLITMPDQGLAMTLELLRRFVPGSVHSSTPQF